MDASARPGDPLAISLRHAAAVAELAAHLGGEITALAQEVHAAWSPLARVRADVVGRIVYGGIGLGFRGARRAAVVGGRLAGAAPQEGGFLDVQSALNGAFGHLFEDARSPFALPMTWIRRDPTRAPAPRLVVFLHGLCMNERGWRRLRHARFCDWAEQALDAEIAYVRYNTGLRISTNGARLSALLERESAGREVVLVGHSMGGLVARSALHQAQEAGDSWPRRVTHLACLGSPHEGASLERLGNHANRLLAVSPWTRPFMRLGNLRSHGILDLRFGHLLASDWQGRAPDDARPAHSAAPLPEHVEHLFVAASRFERASAEALGDWLVPVDSALASNLYPHAAVRRERVRDIGHIALLGDARVYELLRRWLEG